VPTLSVGHYMPEVLQSLSGTLWMTWGGSELCSQGIYSQRTGVYIPVNKMKSRVSDRLKVRYVTRVYR
jgi:hypothetical protein